VQGGEVKAATLLKRGGPAIGGGSIVRLTLQSLLRVFGAGPRSGETDPEVMRVEHIMRTNVQFIRASATFDEVLHFIERSTYNHFPVVTDEGEFTGVIHFSDVRDVIYDPTLRELITAVDLTDPDSRTVPPSMTLTDLLEVFASENVGVLPVSEQADSRRVVGVVEQRDLLRALHLPPRATR
jgi:CBS domain-containing protein